MRNNHEPMSLGRVDLDDLRVASFKTKPERLEEARQRKNEKKRKWKATPAL